MKFQFKIQQYQTDAVDNTVSVFAGQPPHCNRKTGNVAGKEINAYRSILPGNNKTAEDVLLR